MSPSIRTLAAPVLVAALALPARPAAPGGEPPAAAPVTTTLPVPVRIVDPPLPDTLLGRCRPGRVVLRLRIDPRGLVAAVQLVTPFPATQCADSSVARRIDALALAAMHEWAFLPAITAGLPQSIVVDLPVYVPGDTLHVPRHDGTVTGTVVDAVKGEPVPGARVRLDGSALTTRADRDGRFRFDHLVRLRTAVIAEHIRFLPDTALADVVPGQVATVRLRLPLHPSVAPGGAGTGR